MESRYSLLFQKDSGSVVDSYTEWGILCCKVPFKAGGKTKDVAKRDWHDEHGEDTYIPSKLMFESYDVEFEMAYCGKELASNPFNLHLAFQHIDDFKKWLSGNNNSTGSGARLKIYSPYSSVGRQGCYLTEIDNEEPHLQLMFEAGNLYHENVVTFKLKFRVTDPISNISLSMSSSS